MAMGKDENVLLSWPGVGGETGRHCALEGACSGCAGRCGGLVWVESCSA